MNKIVIRTTTDADLAALERLYAAAFPEEDLVPLVRQLAVIPDVAWSLVATDGAGISGHAALTQCGLSGSSSVAALLGPVAVEPTQQGRGIGTALIRDGLQRAKDGGVCRVLVLGDPAYYGRFGFRPEARVRPPFELPADWHDAWQSLRLAKHDLPGTVRLEVPAAWNDPALWAP